jgi:hypothetical protein
MRYAIQLPKFPRVFAGAAFAMGILVTSPIVARGQQANPCTPETGYKAATDTTANVADETAKATDAVVGDTAKVNDQINKLKASIWPKKNPPKPAPAPPAPPPAAVNALTNATGAKAPGSGGASSGGHPCTPPAKPGNQLVNQQTASATPAKPPTAPTAPDSPIGQTAPPSPNSKTDAPAGGISSTVTHINADQYMIMYKATDTATTKTYAKVKKISDADQAGSTGDGMYTDDKNYYSITNGKLTVTPIGQ